MPTTPWIPVVKKVNDGQEVRETVINPILDQHTQREQHLYEKFEELLNKSVLAVFDQPIHPDELAPNPVGLVSGKLDLVYFKTDINGSGVCRAVTGFTTSSTNSAYAPANSNYVYGLVKSVNSGNKVDLYIDGSIDLGVDLDDATYGLLEPGETFAVGPYYLSRRYPGKVTSNPSSIPVFVGYAINKRTFFLNSSVDEFSQLFTNYRYDILDRPAGIPVLTGSTWTITSPSTNRLGWVPVSALSAAYTIPANAKFFYNIPNTFATDDADNSVTGTNGVANGTTTFVGSGFTEAMVGLSIAITGRGTYTINTFTNSTTIILSGSVTSGTGLTYSVTGTGSLNIYEKQEASELKTLLPPTPANFCQLTVNGVIQRFRDNFNPDGLYSIDAFGIWWYSDQDGYQPWASSLTSGSWIPANWPVDKGTDNVRPRLFLHFARFNSSLRNQLVSSIAPYVGTDNDSSGAINFYDKHNPTNLATVGDLLAKLNLQFDADVNATSPTAIANLTFDQVTGKLVRTVTPVVAQLSGVGDISVTESPTGSGKYSVAFQSQGVTGQVTAIEPENSRLEFIGLHSFLRLPLSATVPYGLVGKIILPKNFPNNSPLKLVLHMFGSSSLLSGDTTRNLGFNFEYAVSTVLNSAAPSSITSANNTINTNTYTTASNPITVPFPSGAYTLNQPISFSPVEFTIPGNRVGEDSVINFRLTRTQLGSNNYAGDIGILGIYWTITT